MTDAEPEVDLPVRESLDSSEARRILKDPESHAFACLVAASALIGDEIFDQEDGQPYSPHELGWLFENTLFEPHHRCLTKITGLMFARSGDEFLDDPVHFSRLTAAIVEGDPFAYEDEPDDRTLPDLYWSLYQVGLTIDEEELIDEIGPRVRKYIQDLAEEEVEDLEALAAEVEKEGSGPEALAPYETQVLTFRRAMMAQDLRALGCKAEWIESMDPELAHDLRILDA